MPGDEWLLSFNDIIDTGISVEGGLNGVEDGDGSICSTTTANSW